MSRIDDRIAALGYVLPPKLVAPGGLLLPFQEVQVVGNRVIFSGQAPLTPEGTLAGPFGKVGRDLSIAEAQHVAGLVMLGVIAAVRRQIGDLDRVTAWRRLFGMVNSAAGFNQQPAVINGASALLIEVFGQEVGAHTRSAIGVAELPFDIAVEIEGELEIDGHVD